MRLTSASYHVSFVASIAVTASLMQRQASSKSPSSEYALAKHDRCHGTNSDAPVDRHAASAVVIRWTASWALLVSAKSQPRLSFPATFHTNAPVSSERAITSSITVAADT